MTAGWPSLAEAVGEMTPTELAKRQAEQADRQAELEQAEQDAAAEDEREARLHRYARLGIQPGTVLAEAMRAQEEDAEYDDCLSRMQKIEKRREARRQAAEHQGAQLAAASRASGQPPWVDHANGVAARVDAMLAAAPARPRARRPFVSRGAAEPVMCPECAAVGATEEESFMIHHEPDRLPVPDDWQPPADRQGRRHGQVITR